MSSSPFFEQPDQSSQSAKSSPSKPISLPSPFKRILKSATFSLPYDVENGSLMIKEKEYLKKIASLEYKVSALRNDLQLKDLDNQQASLGYEKKLNEQKDEINNLSDNEKYLFEKCQELNTNLANLKKNYSNDIKGKDSELSQLRKDLRLKNDKVIEYKYELDKILSVNSKSQEEYDIKLKNKDSLVEQLQIELNSKLEENKQDKLKISELMNELESSRLKSSTENNNNNNNQFSKSAEVQGNDIEFYEKQVNDQLQYIQELEAINSNLSKKFQKISNNHDLVEVLKEEKKSLTNKLENYRDLETKYEALNFAKLKLENDYNKWFKILNEEENGVSPYDFLNKFQSLVIENKSLKEKNIASNVEINNLQIKIKVLQANEDSNQSLILDLQKEIKNLKLINTKNDQFKAYSKQEIQFYQNQIDFLQKENVIFLEQKHQKSNEEDKSELDLVLQETKQKNDVISELNNLVNSLKEEISSIIKEFEMANSNQDFHIGGKRKRVSDDIDITQNSILHQELDNTIKEITNLKIEIERKDSQLKSLNDEVKNLQINFETQLEQKQKKLPQQEEIVNIKMFESLKKENQDLLKQLNKTGDVQKFPKSVYDRLSLEQDELEARLVEANKKLTKLREIFKKESLKFNQIIYKLLGFKIEFQSQTRIKIISKFLKNEEYLVFDIVDNGNKNNFKLKINFQDCKILPSNESQIHQLAKKWLNEDQEIIPCFLSALNLEWVNK